MQRRSSLRAWVVVAVVATTGATHAQQGQNQTCWPWRTTVSALPYGDEPIYGNSAEEVCRSLIARGGNPVLVNADRVSVTKTFTGLDARGGDGSGFYCMLDRHAVMVGTGTPVPSESGPTAIDGVGRQNCEPCLSDACGRGNPTDPALGIKTEAQTDYAGAGAHPLQLVRSYRSQGMTPANQDSAQRWTHNYALALEIRRQPIGDPLYGDIFSLVARRADNRGVPFSQTNPGVWRALGFTKDTVTEQRDAANALVGYRYKVFDDDRTEHYDLTGRLSSIVERNGWTTTLTYSDAGTPGHVAPRAGLLIAVRNHFGRELRFTYDAQGRIAEALPPGAVAGSGAGAATSPIRYAYDEAASLGPGVPPQGQLTSVTWQDGAVRRYHYEHPPWPQALTGITDEAGVRWATYSYDNWGRVTRSEHVGGADRTDFVYDRAPSNRARTTVTTYEGGGAAASAYEFSEVPGRATRQVYSVSASCPECGAVQLYATSNAFGDPTKTIAHDGTVTFHVYNARGQETERATFPASFNAATTRPALANATKVVSTKWHGTFNLPTQVAEPGKFTANTYNAKGMLTGQSWTATTDATGAAKFNAVKTGATFATGWGYNANSLNTSIVTRETAQGSSTAVETGRWTLAYEANGDARRVAATAAGATAIATLTSSATHGQLTTLSVDNGALAQFGYDARNRLVSAQLPDYGATLTHDARSLLTEVRFGANNWLRIVYDAAGQPLRVEDSSGASQTIAALSSRVGAEPALGRLRNWLGVMRTLPAHAWLPMASARAQVPPPPPIPGSVLQGMSLAQSQQSALAADALAQAMQNRCCGSAQPSSAAMQSQLQRATLPIQLMSLAFTQVSEAMRDEFLTLKSAYKLRKNLCAAGVTVPAGCHHAHHIVAVAAPAAQTSRDILARVGIDINDAVNGMFVPCDRHGRLHTNVYYTRVFLDLSAAPETRVDVERALASIRASIAAGAYP